MKIVILNKPYDVLSQFRKDEAHMTVSDFVDDPTLRIAGRLDMDSEGLVFLTDHGGLNQFITNPANKKYKTYLVQVDGDVTEEALEQLRKGVELNDGMTLPAKAIKVSEPEWLWDRDPPVRYRASIPTSWIEISICEGRNRQVRRMTSAVGFPTLRLIRTKIGTIDLVQLGLQPGETKSVLLQPIPDEVANSFGIELGENQHLALAHTYLRKAEEKPQTSSEAGKGLDKLFTAF